MDFKEKIKQRTEQRVGDQPSAETTGADDATERFDPTPFFGIDNIRNFPPCIDLRLPDGNCKAIPYSFIVEMNFQKSEGIEILTTNKKISIFGRNLQRLYDYLILFRVKFIQSNIGHDTSEESSLFIKQIVVEEI